MLQYLSTFFVGIFTIILMDGIWLGFVIDKFIKTEFAHLVVLLPDGSIKLNLQAGIGSWALIVLGCFVFVVSRSTNWSEAMIYGALFGAVTYGIYDLTNLTFIKGYSQVFTLVDIGWGIVLCSVVSVVMFVVYNMFSV